MPLGIIIPNDRFGDALRRGYVDAHYKLKERLWESHIKQLENGLTPANAALELFKHREQPWTIMFADAQGAVAAYEAFKEQKLNLKDMKFIFFGENIHSELFEYPIVSIKRDFKELGLVAGKMLLEQIKEAPNQCRRHIETLKIELKI